MNMALKAALIPADETLPIQFAYIWTDPSTLQRLCDGRAQALVATDVALYISQLHNRSGLPANPRCTRLAHAHGMTHFRRWVAGDAVLVGFNAKTGMHQHLPARHASFIDDPWGTLTA